MFARKGFSLAFLLVSVGVLLMVATTPVKADSAESTERSCDKNGGSDLGAIEGFFHKVTCGLKTGAGQVKETVNSGYEFVKNKISSKNEQQTPPPEIDLRSDAPAEPIKLADFPKRR